MCRPPRARIPRGRLLLAAKTVRSCRVTPRPRRLESLRGGGAQMGSRSHLYRPLRTPIPRGRLLLVAEMSRARYTPIPLHRESPQMASRCPKRPRSGGAQIESDSHLRRTNPKTHRSCLVLKDRPRRQAKILWLVAMIMEGRVRALDAFVAHLHKDPGQDHIDTLIYD